MQLKYHFVMLGFYHGATIIPVYHPALVDSLAILILWLMILYQLSGMRERIIILLLYVSQSVNSGKTVFQGVAISNLSS